ncbi:MAG TPA: uroporphyrinogen-III synthase [Ignavibacteria bacterium]
MSISGKIILNTRPIEDSNEFNKIIESQGGKIINFPCIEIIPLTDFTELDQKINLLDNYSGVIFTSSNAAKNFFERLICLNIKFEGQTFAVGSKTKKTIEDFGYLVSHIPESYNSVQLAETILKENMNGKPFLFPRGNLSMQTILDKVDNVEDIIVYYTKRPQPLAGTKKIKEKLNNKEINCVAFFSPSAVNNFLYFFPEAKLSDILLAAIGNTTLKRAEEMGLKVNIKANISNSASLAGAIINYYNEL